MLNKYLRSCILFIELITMWCLNAKTISYILPLVGNFCYLFLLLGYEELKGYVWLGLNVLIFVIRDYFDLMAI
jgi:hypothetical protein